MGWADPPVDPLVRTCKGGVHTVVLVENRDLTLEIHADPIVGAPIHLRDGLRVYDEANSRVSHSADHDFVRAGEESVEAGDPGGVRDLENGPAVWFQGGVFGGDDGGEQEALAADIETQGLCS
jgi:hypothetical protein